MSKEELIHISFRLGMKAGSARELYEFLERETKFTDWYKRMFEYGFEEGRDFTPILVKSTGGRPSMDYALSLDRAKETSMLKRTDKCKQAKLYFIEMEKTAVAMAQTQQDRRMVIKSHFKYFEQ